METKQLLDDFGFPIIPQITQQCRHCRIRKPLYEYGRDKRGRYGHETRCKACSRVQHKRATNAKLSLGGKPSSDYLCPICLEHNEYEDWCPDHDNGTGLSRQWLCRECNTGLGRFNDDPRVVLRVLSYLARHGKGIAEDDFTRYLENYFRLRVAHDRDAASGVCAELP